MCVVFWSLREISVLSVCFKKLVTEEYVEMGFGNYLKCKLNSFSSVSCIHPQMEVYDKVRNDKVSWNICNIRT